MNRHVLAGLVLLPALACTNAQLYGVDPRGPPDVLTIEGSVCTDDPGDRQFPVKVLFLVDAGIPDADYIDERASSVERVTHAYPGGNYTFGVIRYSGPLKGTACGQRNLTPDGFTKDVTDALAGLRCSDTANPGRSLMDALSLANSIITGDVLQSQLGVRSRTKYVVILMANGRPTVSLPDLWCSSQPPPAMDDMSTCAERYNKEFCGDLQPRPTDCERYQYVSAVRGLKKYVEDQGAQQLFFHAVYQRNPDDSRTGMDDALAVDLYSEMAVAGGGSLFRFASSALCDPGGGNAIGCLFSGIDLGSTEAVFARKTLIVANRNALARAEGPQVDTDGDGLSDDEELALGTCPTMRDTDGDHLSDSLENSLRAVNLDPLKDQSFPDPDWPLECPPPGGAVPGGFAPDQDQDGDGLTDCEENLLRTNRSLYDSDADGVPDLLEITYGTNALQSDPLLDPDADGLANIDEYRSHLDPLSRDRRLDHAYQYEIANEQEKNVLSFTQPFGVTGVQVDVVSDPSSEGRATVYFEPPPIPSLPLSPSNAAKLGWRDPMDSTPNPAYPVSPGRGSDTLLTADGTYVIHSGKSNRLDPAAELSATVEVVGVMLPQVEIQDTVLLRRGRRFCFDFRVDNVQLMKTGSDLPCSDANGNGKIDPEEVPTTGHLGLNYVDVYLAEVPKNNPTSFGIFRVATIPAQYPKDPKKGHGQVVKLQSRDFLLFGD